MERSGAGCGLQRSRFLPAAGRFHAIAVIFNDPKTPCIDTPLKIPQKHPAIVLGNVLQKFNCFGNCFAIVQLFWKLFGKSLIVVEMVWQKFGKSSIVLEIVWQKFCKRLIVFKIV